MLPMILGIGLTAIRPGAAAAAPRPASAAPATGDATGGGPPTPSAPREPTVVGETVVRAAAPTPFEAVATTAGPNRPVGNPTSVADRLAAAPSVVMQRNARGEQRLLLHGFEQPQIIVHFEGLPLRLPYDGQLDLGKMPQGLIRSISLVRGPAPLAQGPTGMGGAVALRGVSPADAPRLALSARGAGHALQASVSSAWGGDAGGVVLASDVLWDRGFPLPAGFSGGQWEQGGRRENADRRAGSVGLVGRARAGPDHRFTVLGLGWLGAYGVPPGVSTPAPRFWRFSEYDVALLAAAHEGRYGHGLRGRERLDVGLYRNVLVGYDDDRYASRRTDRAFRSTYEDLTVGLGEQLALALPGRGALRRVPLRLDVALRYDGHRQRDEQDRTPAVGELTGDAVLEGQLRFGGADSSAGTGEGDGERHAVVAQLQATGAARVHGGAGGADGAGDADGADGGAPDHLEAHWVGFVGGLLGYAWQRRRVSVAVTVARRARFPTLRERFSEVFGRQRPNPGLRPESAWHGWASVVARPWPWLRLSALPFAALLTDLIERQATGDGAQQQRNAGRAWLAGVEVAADVITAFGLQAHLGYQFLHTERLAGTDSPPGPLPGRAPHQAVARLRYDGPHRVRAATAVRLRAPMPAQHPDTGLVSDVPTCVRWDARLSLGPYRGTTVLLSAENLLDARCETAPGYPEPGRVIWAGLAFRYR